MEILCIMCDVSDAANWAALKDINKKHFQIKSKN